MPIVADLLARWLSELARVPVKSKLEDAVRTALARQGDLKHFLEDGQADLHCNAVERTLLAALKLNDLDAAAGSQQLSSASLRPGLSAISTPSCPGTIRKPEPPLLDATIGRL